ncbi:MAG: BMP family ABC transporter substrate-binding protein [Bauldia sp.]|uniref:BMP family lipoprotein n=1 Tax=Bauldia sp. TaxID=2575872 RepID=UPI001DE11CFF|nr:BMP family ABC transporter substrate-binding protein [Bauldia sp.]MCB1494748.1 BMP family ABC transporter substrate-binding protein [Bauldia sp.]
MLKIKSRIAAFCGASLLMAGTALAADVKVAAISGYFAQGFGQSIVAGLNKAKDDFGVEVKLIDTGNRALDYEEQFNNVAKDGEYDLVFVMGWELVDALTKAAEAYPDQRFIFIDGVLDSDKIVYADFSEEEGSFVTGAFASLMAAKGSAIDGLGDGKSIGFVGGRDIPVIRNFLRGYEQGAKAAAPDVAVDAVFAGTFDDPAKGSELTMALYGEGNDIVYNVAGPTGEGVLQASAAADKYSIGVDIDQCDVAPGHVMASMLKRGDIAVYSLIKDEVEGRTVKPGTYSFDLKSGGVELLMCPQTIDMVPEDVKSKVSELRDAVINGDIKITE